MHKWAEKAVLSPPISGREALFPIYTNGCRPRAMTIASSLMGGCGLSQEYVEDGCMSTCVKFGGFSAPKLHTRSNENVEDPLPD